MNKRISALDDISLVGGTSTPGLTTSDIIPVTDVDDTTGSLQGTTKKVTVANLVAVAPQGDLESANNLSDLANAATARTNLGLGTAATTASTDYATAAQGATADTATQPGDNISTLTNDSGFIDSSGAPVQSVAGKTGVVTLSNTDVSGLGSLATADDVEGTAILSTGETGGTKFLREDGDGTCSFQAVVITDENLRGTANPHIGAFPNQSFKVLDNPSNSAMILADADGTIKFVVKDTTANVFIKKGSNALSRLAEASELPSFSISKDSGEPDIELTDSDGEVYSVVNGDSDTLGANGLPIRQGYQLPNIGANPSPLLISGGSIA